MSTSGHHSQLLSRSNQLLNNQLPHLNNFIPQSPYHTFRHCLQPRQLNLQPQPQHNNFHRRSSSLCRRRSRLHQSAGNATKSRPFWKRTIPLEAHRPRLAEPLLSPPSPPASDSTDDFNTPPSSPNKAERKRGTKSEDLSSAFGRLALSADADLRKCRNEIPSDVRGEGAAKIPGPSKPLQHVLAEAGPPSQRTRQMEKELEKMLLKRYEEAKALEKKKKKEKGIKKEQP